MACFSFAQSVVDGLVLGRLPYIQDKAPATAQHTAHLADSCCAICKELDPLLAENEIERVIW